MLKAVLQVGLGLGHCNCGCGQYQASEKNKPFNESGKEREHSYSRDVGTHFLSPGQNEFRGRVLRDTLLLVAETFGKNITWSGKSLSRKIEAQILSKNI